MFKLDLRIDPVTGPLVKVVLGVSAARGDALLENGFPVPADVSAKGLVDTGASCTCVDPRVVKALDLVQRGSASVYSSTSGPSYSVQSPQYDLSLSILGERLSPPFRLPNLAVTQSHLFEKNNFDVLVGRDILRKFLIVYDGPSGLCTISCKESTLIP